MRALEFPNAFSALYFLIYLVPNSQVSMDGSLEMLSSKTSMPFSTWMESKLDLLQRLPPPPPPVLDFLSLFDSDVL